MQTLSSSKIQSWLSWFLKGILLLGFFVLLARLVDLQVIRGNYFRVLAEQNRIRRVPIVAPRGKIFARGGELLVGNREVKKKLEFDPDEGFKKIDNIDGASQDDIITEWVRDYIYKSNFAHITGYLGEVREDELGKIKAKCFEKGPRRIKSLIGRSGLEEQYDCMLSGVDGEELIEVDASGNKVRVLGSKDALPGGDITTSIDFGLQRKVSEEMRDKKGAILVADGKGEVLALYSSPSYDPNIFLGNNPDRISRLLNDEDLPLFNRAIGGTYHPGSVFKPVVAIAALQEGVINEDYTYEDTGKISFKTPYGDYSYSNWYFTQYGGVEGKINLVKAIARSTDTFFYEVGGLLGVDKLDEWAKEFGLNKNTGIDIPGEVSGLIPSPSWKMDVKGERWFLGNTYHMSIGQGDIALTPLEVNTAISTIANNGIYCPPHIVKPEGDGVSKYKCESLGIDQKNIELVKEGMKGVCESGGTGFPFFDFEDLSGVQVACKTGTAETDDIDESTHAWFVAYAPVDDPKIVVTVLVEKGGEGSEVAGPIARDIFDYWFGVEKSTVVEKD